MGGRLYGSRQGVPGEAWRAALARLPSSLAALAGAALLAFVIAHWFWRIAAPAPGPTLPVPWPQSSAGPLAAAAVFGVAAAGPAPDRDTPVAGAAAGEPRLLGVIAGPNGTGQALFRLADRGPVLVTAGREVAPGLRLDAVYPDRVRLAVRGEARELLLRSPSPLAAAVPPPRAAAVTGAGCAAPAGFRGPTYRINAELLGGMVTQPESWKPLLGESPTGLVVRDGAGFASMLGLKAGDRLREANGVPLTANDDLLAAVVRPLQGNQPVRVRGARDGGELELLLVNASACAPR
jgi:hypothetical protein